MKYIFFIVLIGSYIYLENILNC